MSRKDIIAGVVGVLLVAALAVVVIVFAFDGDDGEPGLEERVAELEERVEELERRPSGFLDNLPEDLPGLLEDFTLDDLGPLLEQFGEEAPDLGRLFEGFENGEVPFDPELLDELFRSFGGEGFGDGRFREFSFDIDPGFVDDLLGEGFIDEDAADELREAFEMLREAFENARNA